MLRSPAMGFIPARSARPITSGALCFLLPSSPILSVLRRRRLEQELRNVRAALGAEPPHPGHLLRANPVRRGDLYATPYDR